MNQPRDGKNVALSIDLGGTTTPLALVDSKGEIIARDNSVMTVAGEGPEAWLNRIAKALPGFLSQSGFSWDQISCAGLSSPGTMDVPAGLLVDPHNLSNHHVGWRNFPVRLQLEITVNQVASRSERIHLFWGNDVDLAGYGESVAGVGRGAKSFVALIPGTGVGGSIIVDGAFPQTKNSAWAELGHITVDSSDDARICPCGCPGHLEAYATFPAMVQFANEGLNHGVETTLREVWPRVDAGQINQGPILIQQQAREGDVFCKELYRNMGFYLGVAVASLTSTLDPDVIAIGGNLTWAAPLWYEHMRETWKKRILKPSKRLAEIRFATLEHSNLIGAGLWAMRSLELQSAAG